MNLKFLMNPKQWITALAAAILAVAATLAVTSRHPQRQGCNILHRPAGGSLHLGPRRGRACV